MLKTGIVADRRYLKHFGGRAHPERPERAEAMIEMAQSLTRPDLKFMAPREATHDEIASCHTPEYIATVARTASLDRFDFDPDTHSSRDTYETALLSAGGVLTAVEAVMDGAVANGFAIVRPPGHHALPNRAMGFCFFNNVAIAAKWLIESRGLKRVMIVDWDVHHGNGVQDIFYESPEVLYVSTASVSRIIPAPDRCTRSATARAWDLRSICRCRRSSAMREYLRVFDRMVMPIGRHFKPEFILVSSGFDAHFRDPLAQMRVTEAGLRGDDAADEAARGGMLRRQDGRGAGRRLRPGRDRGVGARGDRRVRTRRR